MRNCIRVGLLLIASVVLIGTSTVFSQSSDPTKRPEGWQGSWPGDSQGSTPMQQGERVSPGPQSLPSSPGNQVLEIPPHPQSLPEPPRQQAAIPPRPQAEMPRPTQLITVTVTDPQGRYVTGLQPEDFVVYENGEQQTLTYFNTGQNEPVSLGFIVDVSSSMANKIDRTLFALQELLSSVRFRSEVFISAFAGESAMLQDFTDSRPVLRATLSLIQRELRRQGALCSMEIDDRSMMIPRHCGTSLYDALLNGLSHVKIGSLQKKALIVISDGLDNRSFGNRDEVVHTARESGVLIYAIGIGGGEQRSSFFGFSTESIDISALQQTSELTGGRLFTMTSKDVLGNANTLAAATQIISQELNSQYSLGYTPSLPGSHYRDVQVDVRNRDGENLAVRSQKGYTPEDHRERRERAERQGEERRRVERIQQW